MSAEEVNALVAKLVPLSPPSAETLGAALGTTLGPSGQNNFWSMYEFSLAGGAFGGGEARLSRDGARALVSLRPREETPLLHEAIDLKAYGPAVNISANPQIPPEGTDSYSFRQAGVKVTFQFMHLSRRLRTLVLEWGAV